MRLDRSSLLLALGFCASVKATRDVTIPASDRTRVSYFPLTSGSTWIISSSTADCGGDYMFSNADSAYFTVNFTGIAVALRMVRFSSGARINVELDGIPVKTADTYLSTTDCNTPVYSASNLTDRLHTLKVSDATGNYARRWLRFDSLTYTEYTPEERTQVSSSASVASVSSVAAASSSSAAAQSSARAEKARRNGRTAGGVVGGILGFALIVGIVWFVLRRKRANNPPPAVPPPQPPFAQGQDAWKGQQMAYQTPVQPYMPMMNSPGMPPTPQSNFALLPPNGVSYQHSGMTNMTNSSPYGTPIASPHPQSVYSDRPMSQYTQSDSQNMANMVADMVSTRMQSPYGAPGGAPQAPIPEPMEIPSSGRQASVVYQNPGYVGPAYHPTQ